MITAVFAELRQKIRDFRLIANAQEPREPRDEPVWLNFQLGDSWYSGWYSSKSSAIEHLRARLLEIDENDENGAKERAACEKALEHLDAQIR